MTNSNEGTIKAFKFLTDGGDLELVPTSSLHWIASMSDCSEDLSKIYGLSADFYIRNALAENLYTPTEILKLLFYEDDVYHLALASNPSCTKEIFEELVKNKTESVALSLAANPSCPKNIFMILIQHPEYSVREQAWTALRKRDDFDSVDIPKSWIQKLAE